ncbi:MAG: DJ-1/PfpI family protein, partial [Hyphomonadaceae bacterium]|nr:DJ-1/PfpI family protein [Hyphomonadaceae bacterium]
MTDFSGKRFGFVMYDGFEELDLIGPWEMIAMWSAYAGGPGELVTVAETVRPIRCDKGLTCLPDHDFQSCPPLDYLLVPGGFILPVQEKVSPGLIAFIADRGARAEAVLSVCSGTFLLHAAGL